MLMGLGNIHEELKRINNNLENTHEAKARRSIADLNEEIYMLREKVDKLYKLNKDILNEIISKNYNFCILLEKSEVQKYTNKDLKYYEPQMLTIPVDRIVIDRFYKKLLELFYLKEK